jgi:hypothetical protein
MTVICAWCRRLMGEKPPYPDLRVSHSICEECYITFLRKEHESARKPEPAA